MVLGLKLPPELPDSGHLVGWSLELSHVRQPIGFNFGDPELVPSSGYIDPVLMVGEGHAMTIAPTGAGKGTGCIIPALLRYPGPVIVIDPKGENAEVTARRRQELGQEVVVIDPMGLTEFESASINPMEAVALADGSKTDELIALIEAMSPPALGSSSNDGGYWVSRGQQFVLGVALHVMADLPPPERNLTTVRRLVSQATSELGLYSELASKPSTRNKKARDEQYENSVLATLERSLDPEARAIGSMLRIGALTTMGGILSFAQEIVDFVRSGPIADSLERSSFDLGKVTRGDPLSIYLVLPPHMLISHSRVLRLWINTLFGLITRRRRRPEQPTLFILDEAAQLGEFNPLRAALTLMRGYGLQTWSFWQDASQLKQLYEKDWQTMVNNCRVIQFFGANTMLAAQAMADIAGFANPRTLLEFDKGEMLLQISGDSPVVARLPNYLTDPPFQGLFDDNRFYTENVEPEEIPSVEMVHRSEERPDDFIPVRTNAEMADILRKAHERGEE